MPDPRHPRLDEALTALFDKADPAFRDQLGPRYGIDAPTAIGVRMADIKALARSLGRDQALAEALWDTVVYEARLLTSLVAEPKAITPALADRWRADFDNWAVCDTLCFNLFDRLPFAFDLIDRWVALNDEYGRRAGFALLATMALHKRGTPRDLLDRLPLIEAASTDDRNFIKKSVNWALRAIGRTKDADCRAAARALAERLAASDDPAARWIGKDARREFAKLDEKTGDPT